MNGCPGNTTFDVVFHSTRAEGSVFEIMDGKTLEIVQDPCLTDGDIHHKSTEMNETNIGQAKKAQKPPASFELTISLHYDDLFLKNVGGGNHYRARRKIREIFNGAAPMFSSWNLAKTSKIYLKEKDLSHVKEDLQLGSGKLEWLKRMDADHRKQDADNYHYFSWDEPCRGTCTSGIAWRPSVCYTPKAARTAITEYVEKLDYKGKKDDHASTLQASITFAHELGHALNMPHDFCSDKWCSNGEYRKEPRKDRYGNECWKQGSVMDYHQNHVKKWSTCSIEAMNKHDFHCKSSIEPCSDKPGWENNCKNNRNYGGCRGQHIDLFRKNCRKTCNVC